MLSMELLPLFILPTMNQGKCSDPYLNSPLTNVIFDNFVSLILFHKIVQNSQFKCIFTRILPFYHRMGSILNFEDLETDY